MKKLTHGCVTVSVLLSVTVFLISNGSPALAQNTSKVTETSHRVDVPSNIVVKEEYISLLKSALKLRPTQESFWVPVEAALHEVARWQASTSLEANRRSDTAVMARLKRVAAIAVPLFNSLDENQRNSMVMLARTAGLEQLLAAN